MSGCPYDPRPLSGQAIGMYHCPVCDCMILAGLPHIVCDINVCEYGIEIDYSGLDKESS